MGGRVVYIDGYQSIKKCAKAFGILKLKFHKLALAGRIPGVTKASW